MGGLFLGHYNIGTYVSGHVLVCMPDKSTELPIIRETIVKYNAYDAFSTLQSKNIYKYPVLCLFHFSHKQNINFWHVMVIKSKDCNGV